MSSKLRHVDGIIVRSGLSGHQLRPSKGRAAARALPRLKLGKRGGRTAIRNKVQGLAKRKPQVMVKVTGGGRSAAGIRAHFKYITKHGKVMLENDEGEHFNGPEAIDDEIALWASSGYGIRKNDPGKGQLKEGDKAPTREAINLLLSMPAGTDPQRLRDAARDFAKEHFGGKHRYVFGLHTDRGHPHVHIAIKSRSDVDHRRLKVNKRTLQAWRESFAAHLYQHGIEAAATPRAVRNAKSYQRTFRSSDRRPGYDISREHAERVTTPNMTRVAARERTRLNAEVRTLLTSRDAADRAAATAILDQGETSFFSPEAFKREYRRHQLRRADLHQSALGVPASVRAAKPISRLRDLPHGDVAEER